MWGSCPEPPRGQDAPGRTVPTWEASSLALCVLDTHK